MRSLAEILEASPGLAVCGLSSTIQDALSVARTLRPDIILLDVAFSGGVATAARLREAAPAAYVIALAVAETAENVLAWAEAGVAGYVPNTASVADLARLIGQISRGEQSCPSRIAGTLLRRVGAGPPVVAPSQSLTRREHEILHLVEAGLSNKEIARQLGISVGTTKSHVHNLLAKLSISRRTEAITRAHAL